jgi:hypothetical protein
MIRGFLKRRVMFNRPMTMDADALEQVLPDLAAEHAAAMNLGALDMIELEFLDEPNQLERYFRFGVNPAGMVMPIEIDLTKGAL